MTQIEKLAPNQEALMATVRGEWFDFIFKNDQTMDEAAAKSGIAFLYGLARLEPPRVIIKESPIACQLAASSQVSSQIHGQVNDQIYNQIIDQVSGQISGQIRDQVYNQVRDQVRGQISDQVRDQVRGQISDQVRDQVRDQIYDQIYNQVYVQVYGQAYDQAYGQAYDQAYDQKLKYFSPAWCDVLWDAGWLSFYDYFRQIGVINHEPLNKYISYARAGVFYSIFHKNFAILCDRPVYIKRDENSRLHADGAPAILWRDGWSQYFLHGVRVSAEYALTPAKKLDPKVILAEKNVDIQRELIRKIGAERLLIETGAKELDNWQDPNTGFKYKLVDMRIGDNIRRRYLYFQHASMPGIFYTKPVPPETKKAFHARAWILSLVEREELNHITVGKEAEIIANFPTRVS